MRRGVDVGLESLPAGPLRGKGGIEEYDADVSDDQKQLCTDCTLPRGAFPRGECFRDTQIWWCRLALRRCVQAVQTQAAGRQETALAARASGHLVFHAVLGELIDTEAGRGRNSHRLVSCGPPPRPKDAGRGRSTRKLVSFGPLLRPAISVLLRLNPA